MTPLLDVQQLEVSYGRAQVLWGVDIVVGTGELVAIIGNNGAGKSTLLRAISGLVPAQSGTIALDGRVLAALSPQAIARMGIAHVPEGRRVLVDQSTEDNLYLGAYCRWSKEGSRRVRADIEAMFERFPIIAERRDSLAGNLSGGEQQVLAIARALMSRPKLLMLDEPSLGLAPAVADQVFDLLESEREHGTTILLVEQNAHRALTVADRGYVLSRGQVSVAGSGRDLLADPQIRSSYLGAGAAAE